jgi:hypothetical protein
MVKLGSSAENAFARKTLVELIETGPEYKVEAAVGSEPSVVYRIVADPFGHVIETV